MINVLNKLHDATLTTIRFDWKSKQCEFQFDGGSALPGTIVLSFSGVTELTIPSSMPWGPSVSVLSAKETAPGRFEIEMQSGDTISVVAPNNSFNPTAEVGPIQ